MKIVITGGAGFIGSNFIHYIMDKYPNYYITCIDALTYAGSLKTLHAVLNRSTFKFYQADITDKEVIEDIMHVESPDLLINFAAESHVDRSIHEPIIFSKTNLIGTQVLLDACRKYNIGRFHQISTDEVYGDLPYDENGVLFSEEAPLRPSNPYAASKAAADLLVLSYHRTYDLPVTISRSTNNYGPRQHSEKLIPLVITNALKNRVIPVYGTGENVRNWLYVSDHCEAIDLILHRGMTGNIYNISGQSEMSNLDLIKMILKELGKPESLIQFVKDRAGHDRKYAINSQRVKVEFEWMSKTKIEEGIRRVIDTIK